MENQNLNIIYDFNKTCRTCLSQENGLVSIFSNEKSPDTPYSDMIMTFSPFKITEDDDLPHVICLKCVYFTNIAYTFKTGLEISEKTLLNYLSKRVEETPIHNFELEEPVVDNNSSDIEIPYVEEDDKNMGEKEDLHEEIRIIHEKAFKNETKPASERALCNICNKSFTVLSMRRHKLRHKQQLIKNMKKEEMSEVKDDELVVNCPLCDHVFASRITLKRHISARHRAVEIKSLAAGTFPNYSCSMCNQCFITEDILIEHINSHNETICTICKKLCSSQSALKSHLRNHTGEKLFLCNICGKGFTQQPNLQKHIRNHNNVKPFACELCGKKLTSLSSLRDHIARHSVQKPQVCPKCGKHLEPTEDISAHQCLESEIKRFECDVCLKRFKTVGALSEHFKSHSGEKPFVCHICGLTFSYKGNIKKHLETHSGEKTFMCNVCGKRFVQKRSLKHHLKCHELNIKTE